ncbi:hypothetical protein Tco_0344040 [Tanacetum coccineum]
MSNTSDKGTMFGDGAARVDMQLESSPKVSTYSPLVSPSSIINVSRELYSIDVAATFGVPLTTVGDLQKLINDIDAGKHDELLSELTNEDRMETLEALGSICNSIKVDRNNADVIPCKVSHADDSINLNVDESTIPSDPIVQSVDINKSTSYVGVAVVEKVNTRFEHTLYGYFIGKRMAFPVVEYYARNNWAKHGLKRIMMNSKGFFFFKFDSRAGLEALKTQVANCTKTNLENKSVNDTLTAELERYKEQVKVLKEGQNVDLRSKDNVSDTCAQSVEIDLLKQTLSEHLKEKESLLQTVTLLKNDFKKEESRNIDREIALEKQIKHLDNIVFKRDQSAQTVHMLTKPQFFYDNTTKQALGFQNPFYLQKAQQSKPKLYVGDIIVQTNPIVIPDSEETLALAEESRSKMLLKHKDNMMLEKEKQNSVNSSEPTLSIRPTNVEVPKELPKVSMVNTSLKKLKQHIANFDEVVKERTTPTAITEGSWGFEHTKACFRDEIIPFVKALKDLFSTFNQHLVDELSEVQNVFYQMEQAVEQHRIESKTFEVKMNQVLNENERLLEQVMSKDIVNLIANSSVDNDSVNVRECQKCLKPETKLQTNFVEKEIYDKLFKSFTIVEKHCISLEVDTQLKQEIFQRENSVSNQSVPSFDQLFELNELKAQSQEKDTVIKKLKERIKSLSGNMDKDKIKQDLEEIETINIELDHREEAAVLRDLIDHIKVNYPLDSALEYAYLQSLSQIPSSTLKNKVEAHPRKVKSSLKNKDCVVAPKGTAHVQHSKLNANYELKCVKCNGCMLSDNHDLCVLDFINNVNARAKSRSVKKNSKRKVWKPTGKVFTNIGYIWRPTGQTFTIVGNACPLTRITITTEVPLRKSSALDNKTPKPVIKH